MLSYCTPCTYRVSWKYCTRVGNLRDLHIKSSETINSWINRKYLLTEKLARQLLQRSQCHLPGTWASQQKTLIWVSFWCTIFVKSALTTKTEHQLTRTKDSRPDQFLEKCSQDPQDQISFSRAKKKRMWKEACKRHFYQNLLLLENLQVCWKHYKIAEKHLFSDSVDNYLYASFPQSQKIAGTMKRLK